MDCAEYLATFLRARGVTHVFGLPGGETVLLLDALGRAGIEFVLVHHEASAGFAAGVTGQLTDTPGVCLATVGPGAVNLLSAAISASLERSPVLAITAEIDASLRPRVTHMKADLTGLFEIGAKASIRLTPDNISFGLRYAWQLAMERPRGAVHLSLSPESASRPVAFQSNDDAIDVQEDAEDICKGVQFERARELLQSATRPFLLAGLGVEADRAHRALLTLAEAWQSPVAVTPKAKGQFPESHRLFAGCFSAYGDSSLRSGLSDADVVLGIGLDGVDLVTSQWDIDTPLISVSSTKGDDPVFSPAATVKGELTAALRELRALRVATGDGVSWAQRIRDGIAKALITPFAEDESTVKIEVLISALRDALEPSSVVTLDVGAFKLVFLQQWRTDQPKSLFVANGLSAMGYALPGALAVKLARPDKRVVAVVGDGALLMYAGELATIARLKLPIVVLVVVDQALSLIRLKQIRQNVTIYGTEFNVVDYRSLSAAFGLEYRLIDRSDGASNTLQEALATSRPVLVEARINKSEYNHFR